ncbi:MAG: protoporphyrinogen oxidase [Vampirovibrionales bacterium]|jgi:oxygen-dependent protoporphyrinogen oxidase|nr:protoporphyrinogen oxidase [Vampirovibrionales bacterium]
MPHDATSTTPHTLKDTAKPLHPSPQQVFHHATPPKDAHVVVVGSGLCGLVSAYRLTKAGVSVTLLEAGERLGGNIMTHVWGDFTTEAGPNSFPSSSRELMQLLEEIKLRPLAASPLAKYRYITLGTSLVKVPMDPVSFFLSPLLSLSAKLRLFQEPWIAPYHGEEETVEAFVCRRLGKQVHQRLVQPFLTGVYAGDTAKLSAQSVFPTLVEWEQAHGSIVKGALHALFHKKKRPKLKTKASMQKNKHALLNFPDGMESLVERLASLIGYDAIRPKSRVEQLTYNGDPEHGRAWRIRLSNGVKLEADAIILATPAYATADILDEIAPEPARSLGQIEYAPIHVVYQAFALKDVTKRRRGFGTLRALEKDNPFQQAWLGSLWTSSLFPERCPKGHLLLSHFFGGALHPEVKLWDDGRCMREASQQSQWMLQLNPKAKPVLNVVYPYMRGIPQYHVGHKAKIDTVQGALNASFGGRLQITGNYVGGINLNKCVISAQTAVEEILKTAIHNA